LEEEADSEDLLVVVCDTTKHACKKAVKGRKEWLAEFNGRLVCMETVKTCGQTAHAMTNDENVANEQLNQEPPNPKEREKKKHDEGFQEMDGHSR
jgi:hypothetical protein